MTAARSPLILLRLEDVSDTPVDGAAHLVIRRFYGDDARVIYGE